MNNASTDQPSEQLSILRGRLDRVDEDIRLLTLRARPSWYKDVATLISVFALVFSLGTTIVTALHTREQDIHDLRTELRGLQQRLAALQKEDYEVSRKYINDPTTMSGFLSLITQESILLSRQADEILRRLPSNQIAATDYIAVANGQEFTRMFELAIPNLKRAIAVASNLDDEVAALRSLAGLEMTQGNIGEARAHFQQALDVFGKDTYRGYDQSTKLSTNTFTELLWATAEKSTGNSDQFQQHTNRAEQLVNSMSKGPDADYYRGQVNQLKNGQAVDPHLTRPVDVPATPLSVSPAAPARARK
jgi:hypothetical protein